MFTKQKTLPSVESVLKRTPLDASTAKIKQQFDEQIKRNFLVREKFVVVCGPCSADVAESMHEYFEKLRQAQTEHPNLLIIARVYTTKPHSNGQGYQGTCFHKHIGDEIDLEEGITRARAMMIDCLKLGLPVADELLYPELYPYFSDLVSYWFIGARSSEDALHRGIASGLDLCCGVKNGTDGDILKVIDSLYAISNPCVFPSDGLQIATDGCKYAHVVLRGGKSGTEFENNISSKDIMFAKDRLNSLRLNDFVMADLSHANSGKVAVNQIENAKKIATDRIVDGTMIESYLYGGTSDDAYGVSKTDDCLGFVDTLKVLEILNNAFVKV